MAVEIVKGDLIKMALEGNFDVIAHGCNCFCRMKRGIAVQMAETFGCDKFALEDGFLEGDMMKLGNLDFRLFLVEDGKAIEQPDSSAFDAGMLAVINMYTQYHWEQPSRFGIPLDYDALTLGFKKLNHLFRDMKIGLPWIGCGLAGGDIALVNTCIRQVMKDCDVTIVELP